MQVRQRGDTIVEVTMAFAIFTLLILGAMTIMNHSMAIAQRSLEMTQVRQVINGQADILRVARTNTTIWGQIKANALTAATSGNITTSSQLVNSCPTSLAASMKAFIVGSNPAGSDLQYLPLAVGNFKAAPVSSWIDYTPSAPWAYGVWVQAVQVSGTPAAYDMYIRACWNTTEGMPATLATIVRLYDVN